MIPEVQQAREQIASMCRRHNVVLLELFGSATGPDFDPSRSDLDFLVEFGPFNPGEYSEHYFALLEKLVELFNRPVDLVVTRAVRNPYCLQSIQHSRELLFGSMQSDVRSSLDVRSSRVSICKYVFDIEQAVGLLRQFVAENSG